MKEIGQQASNILLDQFLEVALIDKAPRTLTQVTSTLIYESKLKLVAMIMIGMPMLSKPMKYTIYFKSAHQQSPQTRVHLQVDSKL